METQSVEAQGLTVESSQKFASEKKAATEKKPDTRPASAPAAKPPQADEPTTSATSATSTTEATSQADQPGTPSPGIQLSNPAKFKWKVTAKAVVGRDAVNRAVFTFPVPQAWPEQTVEVVDQVAPDYAIIGDKRKIDPGLSQWVVGFQKLNPGAQVFLTKTFLVTTQQIDPPKDTSVFVMPSSRAAQAKKYLKTSPGINFQNSKLKKQAKELVNSQTSAWSQVEAIFDWTRDNIDDVAAPIGPIAEAFTSKKSGAETKVALFVGMCRSQKIPARMVWTQGAVIAEFMLVDASGKPHWFPCNLTGLRDFGSNSDPRIILQKGDNFKVPEKPRSLQFVSECFHGTQQAGAQAPVYKLTSELLPIDEE